MIKSRFLSKKKMTSIFLVVVMIIQLCVAQVSMFGVFGEGQAANAATLPIVTGIVDGQTYGSPVSIYIAGAFKASLNGQEIDKFGVDVKEDGQYELRAVNIDGGKTIINFFVSVVKAPVINFQALALETQKIDESIAQAMETPRDTDLGFSIEPAVVLDLTASNEKNIQVAVPAEKITEMNTKSLGLTLDTKDVKINIDSAVLKDDVVAENLKEVIVSKATVEEDKAEVMKSQIIKDNPDGKQISEVRDFNLEIKDQDENVKKVMDFSKKVDVSLKLTEEEIAKLSDPKKAAVYNLLPNGTYEYVGGNFDEKTGTMNFETSHFSFYVVMENNKTFKDISASFAMKDIQILASRNILKGTDATNYNPKGTITRGQFAIMISKVLGFKPERYSVIFRDVSDKSYYTGYVMSAYKYNIIKGADGTFRPDDIITREQIATIMVNAMKNVNAGLIKENGDAELTFSDKASISTYALSSISEAKRLGIMKGFPDNSFLPKKALTREEAAAAIVSLMNAAKML